MISEPRLDVENRLARAALEFADTSASRFFCALRARVCPLWIKILRTAYQTAGVLTMVACAALFYLQENKTEYVSAETGMISVGDVVTIGGLALIVVFYVLRYAFGIQMLGPHKDVRSLDLRAK